MVTRRKNNSTKINEKAKKDGAKEDENIQFKKIKCNEEIKITNQTERNVHKKIKKERIDINENVKETTNIKKRESENKIVNHKNINETVKAHKNSKGIPIRVENNNDSKLEKKKDKTNFLKKDAKKEKKDKPIKNTKDKTAKNTNLQPKGKDFNTSNFLNSKVIKKNDKIDSSHLSKADIIFTKKENNTIKNKSKINHLQKNSNIEVNNNKKSTSKNTTKNHETTANNKHAKNLTDSVNKEKCQNIKLRNKKENRAKNKIKLLKKSINETNNKHKTIITKDLTKTITSTKKSNKIKNASNAMLNRKNSTRDEILNPSKNKLSTLEREMLNNGTKKDKIDVLTLIIEKNPNNCFEELSQLLEMAQNERNETVFYILKNIKDLLLSKLVLNSDFTRLKRKLVSTLEYYLKNQFIKNKIIALIFALLSKNILFIDLIYIFTNKLGDKKETSNFVVKLIEKLYLLNVNREIIVFALEELFQRDIKARKKTIEAMNKIAKLDDKPGKLNMIFYQTLRNKEYTDKTKFEKTLENVLLTFLNDIESIDKESFDETLLFQDYKLQSLNFTILRFLYKTKSEGFYRTLLNCIRKDKMTGYKNMIDYINFIHECLLNEEDDDKKYNIFESLFSGAIFYDDRYILSLLIIFSQIVKNKEIKYTTLHILGIFLKHTNVVISLITSQILENKEVAVFNPFDNEETERILIMANSDKINF